METLTKEESLKLNAINLVKEHREKCSMGCNVSVYQVYELLKMAGIELTKEESKIFF